jgi:hypothetical protein
MDQETARRFTEFLSAAREEIERDERLCLVLAPGSTAEISEQEISSWPPDPTAMAAITARIDSGSATDTAPDQSSSPCGAPEEVEPSVEPATETNAP